MVLHAVSHSEYRHFEEFLVAGSTGNCHLYEDNVTFHFSRGENLNDGLAVSVNEHHISAVHVYIYKAKLDPKICFSY